MARSTARRVKGLLRGSVAAGVLLVVALYLAGSLLLWTLRLPPKDATPVTVVRYAVWYWDRPKVRGRVIGSSVAAFTFLGLGMGLALRRRKPSLHGDARWATLAEISDAGLFKGNGIILGKLGRRFLTLPGQQGVLLAAPPRSGKGVSLIVPNLLSWNESVVTVDIKGENWDRTAGFRKRLGHEVFRFDPFNPKRCSHRWNPLDYAARNPAGAINGLQLLADSLFPDIPKDPFWPGTARGMFVGLGLYVFETPELPQTLGEMFRQGMVGADSGLAEHWRQIFAAREHAGRPLSRECQALIGDIVSSSIDTSSSIRKTFTTALSLWMNPILDAATAASDFNLEDLRRRPMSIYVTASYEDLSRLQPVLNLFFQQTLGLLTRCTPEQDPTQIRQVLLLLDEFTAIGRIPILCDVVGVLPGYNVRMVLVMQAQAQLEEVYGPTAAAIFNQALGVRVVFTPKEHAVAENVSRELGNTTVAVKAHSHGVLGGGKAPSVTVSLQPRPLMLAQEVKEMDQDSEIILYENLRPIKARKVRYFEDPVFMSRVLPPPEVPTMSTDTHERPAPSAGAISRASPVESPSGTRTVDREVIPAARGRRARSTSALGKRRQRDAGIGAGESAGALDPELDRAVQAFLNRTPGGKSVGP
jgi:type IV secretion system protein VirD4